MDRTSESEGMHYEGNCIRPPPEAYSILLQVTLGCSHNKCTFCGTYKDKRFRIKDDAIILSDILFASKYMKNQDRVFLMDGDALIIPQKRLVWILDRIHEHLPRVKGIGSYANTKSIRMKSPEDLINLRQKGMLIEMKEILAHTHLSGGTFASNHASNYLSVKAKLPRDKQEALDLIDAALRGEIGLKPEWMRAF